MKRIITFIIAVSFIQGNMIAQENTKKILLAKGFSKSIQYKNLYINTLLQVYDANSPAHIIGDVYLRVDNNGETIAEFYINNDQPEEIYYTKIYKNYFLTFIIENNNKYLIIEQAQFGKTFALSSNGSAAIGSKDDLVEIEITDFYHEWGYDAPPPEDNNNSYSADVRYTLKVKVKDIVKNFSFYSSEVKGNYTMDIENYSISILSDKYKDSSSLIEMIINEKEEK